MVFGEFLVTVVPFLVGVLATPNTYPTAGFRRGTATQVPRDPGQPLPEALVPLVVLLAILAIDLSVYADARRWAAQGAPVVARIGSFAVETPETWFLGCLVLFILFFPLYMVSRAG